MKKILLPTVVTMSLLFAVGCSNSNNVGDVNSNDVGEELKALTAKDVDQGSDLNVEGEKGEVLGLDIKSTLMYKNYEDILNKMNTLSVEEINKKIESSTDKFVGTSHIQNPFSDSGHQLLNEFRYSIRDEEEVVLGITYDAYNSSGDRLPLSEAVVSTVYLDIEDDKRITAVNSEDVKYSVTIKTNEFKGIESGFEINSSLEDMYIKIANLLSENEHISIKDIKEELDISFDDESECVLIDTQNPADTIPTEITDHSIRGDDSYIAINAVDDKVFNMTLSPLYSVDEEVKVSGEYIYSNRRVYEPKRVEALDPEYKPEYFATKEVSDMQQQIELLNSIM